MIDSFSIYQYNTLSQLLFNNKTLTFNQLDDIVASLAKEMSADIQDLDMDLDFLIRASKERLIEVTLDSNNNTTKTESVIVGKQLTLF